MGKTADKAEAKPGGRRRDVDAVPAPASPAAVPTAIPSAFEAHRQREALEQFFREKEEAWANMTAAERDQAEREWQAFRRSMNESRAGGRVPYPD